MSYIKGFTYDIFISYAHMDNEKLSGQTYGWIERFYKDLNLMLLRRIGQMDAIRFWWDNKKLDGSKLFDQSIEEGIRQSAILVCLISPGYLGSSYCKKELELFYKKAQQEAIGLKVGDRSRILNVLLNNIPYTQWPNELSGTTGFPFHDSSEKEDWGDPLDIGGAQIRSQLQDLRDALVQLMNDFPKEEAPLLIKEEPKKEEEKEERFTIYVGEVADTLRTTRKRTIIELEKSGYKVIGGIPPPDGAAAHEKLVKEKLEKADLSVHLLDQYPGREIVDAEEIWYPQKQTELGLQFAKSKLIWVPAELDLASVEEEKYKLFLEGLEQGKQSVKTYEYIRGIKSTVTQEIIDFAGQLRLQQQQQPAKEKISVLLDTHYNDQLYALDLSRTLLENEIQPFINPQEDDPRKNINILSDRIRQVNKLIFFYGKVSKDWVLERMSAALQLIVTNNFPIEDFYIFLAPPHKDPNEIFLKQRFLKINVLDNSDKPGIDSILLQQLLKNLKD
jgi:TIR domain